MNRLIAGVLLLCLVACSSPSVPMPWERLPGIHDNLVRVEESTNEHGFYGEYSGLSRQQLLDRTANALSAIGYVEVGQALDGAVLGYAKDDQELAFKVDEFGDALFLAIFDAKGKEPLLHGVVFGRYRLGEPKTGDEAIEQLRALLED